MDSVFIDSDVILDFLLDRAPHSENALALFSLAEDRKIKIFTSAVVFANCYYVLRRFATHAIVIEKLRALSSFIDFTKMDKNVVLDALHSQFKDFEDSLQNASAVSSGIKILLTRNIKDFKRSELSVMTPDAYLAGLHM